jgi:5'-nucleotidase
VTGAVSEFGTAPNTLTEITAGSVTPVASLGSVVNNTTIPGSDCALGSCPTLAQLDTAKEEFEGELFQPTGNTTVTDAFDGSVTNPPSGGSSSFFGEIGLAANSSLPLLSQTEVAIPDSPAALDRIAFNNAHRLVLDDGSSTTYWNTANNAAGQNQTIPWFSVAPGQENQVRVGAAVTFPQPVVLDYRFGWKVQPTTMVVGKPTATQPQFAQDRPATPAPVGGDLKLATFNVLNYFTTLGVDYDAGPESCTSFPDKDGNPIAVNSCTGNGPRGAWNSASFLRQQAKIVTAINTMDADVVSLEEIENSRKVDGVDRDEALSALVDALNAAAGTTRWAFVDSPATLPAVADEDVIRTGFIYDPSTVDLVGGAQILIGSTPFDNAREPFAQAFKMEGAPNSQGFAVVVNHFKSKGGTGTGDNADTGNGAGSFNGDRTRQAQALNTFATNFAASRGVAATFLTGDFNAYSKETPVTTLNSAGWVNLESTDDPQEESYSFDGMSGSLDHVFANAAAEDLVNGVDIWEINANETVFNQYSRYNYVTPLLFQSGPFSASDHNPEVIGINAPVEPATRDIQILGTNDFHGRLQRDGAGPTAGAAVLSGAVKSLRVANPDTVFAAAGDLIGASTFESFIAHDKPTIDALNEAGLEVSAAGNHEFDQGYHDLIDRVMQPASPSNPEGGASWQYIAANLRLKAGGGHALMPTWTKDFGAVKVGFIGAVTEDLPTLVSPAGISELDVTSIVAEANTSANDLKAAGADVIVLLVHEGAPSTDCATMANPGTAFASIINEVNPNVDAIISGHTHLSYNCHFPVTAWAGRPVTERPVVSAGQYGMQLDKLVFTVDTATGQVQAMTQSLINLQSCTANCTPPATPVWSPNFTADPAVTSIVSAAVANAAVLGAQPLGQLGGPFFRGKLANGTTENRGAESTLGNLVAEVQKWATRNPESGSAQIAFMNPGGLRQDMTGTGTGAFPRTLTYQDAAIVQPFANTLVNMDLTGAQIKKVLEQQWNQPSSRPFLKLGISKGFTYTSVPPPAGSPAGTLGTVTGMWLNGTPIGLGTTYSVTVNSFLAAGGDGFLELANGASKQDTGQTDLAAMVAYMAAFGTAPDKVDPSYKQNGVHVVFPPTAPAGYAPADHVLFSVSGWSMTNALDLKDTAVTVKLGATTLGTATLDNTPQAALPGFDVTGTANVDVVVPNDRVPGPMTLTLVGAETGTESQVTVNVVSGTTSVAAADTSVVYGQAAPIQVTVTGPGATPSGTVHLKDGGTEITSGALDASGHVTLTVPAKTYAVGQVTLTAVYDGDATHDGSTDPLTLTTTKATSTTTAGDTTMAYGQSAGVTVNVGAAAGVDVSGTVTVKNGATTLATAPVIGGVAHVTLPANSLVPGTASLTASYSGNANVNASDDTFTVTVSKAGSTTEADIKPNHPTTKQKVKLTVKVTGANGVEATGKVKVIVDGEAVTKTLDGGKLKLNLGKFAKGKHKVRVIYLGSSTVEGSATKVRFRVT